MGVAIIIFISFMFLLIISVPVSFSLLGATIIGLASMGMDTMIPAFAKMFAGANSWLLLAVPFFVLAGSIMEKGGITQKLVDFAFALVGFLPGGLGAANVVTNMFMGGVSGSAIADTSAIGTILIPAMEKQNYNLKFASALTASSSPLAIMIPPSIPMILWGFSAGLSVGDIFMHGFGPGFLVTISMIMTTVFISVRRGYGIPTTFSIKRLGTAGRDGFLALISPMIIVVSIRSGFATPTEAAVCAVLYSLFIGMFVFKKIRVSDLPKILISSGRMTAIVMFVIAGASAFSYILTVNNIPELLAKMVIDMNLSSSALMVGLMGLYLILGMFLDANAAILLTVPIIAPLIVSAGLNPVTTSVILVLVLGIGLLTPPVGLCVYVVCGISKLKFQDLLGELMPFMVTLSIDVVLLMAFPQIMTAIPAMFK